MAKNQTYMVVTEAKPGDSVELRIADPNRLVATPAGVDWIETPYLGLFVFPAGANEDVVEAGGANEAATESASAEEAAARAAIEEKLKERAGRLLERNEPELCAGIRIAVAGGASPAAVSRAVQATVGRRDTALLAYYYAATYAPVE